MDNSRQNKKSKGRIPKGLMNEDIIGIDLGTTNTCVGIWRNGNVEIIPTRSGKRTLPSFVAYTSCQRYVGDDAKNQKDLNPKNVFCEVKRLIGRKIDDPLIVNEKELFSYDLGSDEFDNILVIPDLENEKKYTPEEISAAILSEAKYMASAYLGKKITKCIITVPAHFNDGQRQATKDAAEISGLECIRIINEPVAAALSYGLFQRSQYEYKKKIDELLKLKNKTEKMANGKKYDNNSKNDNDESSDGESSDGESSDGESSDGESSDGSYSYSGSEYDADDDSDSKSNSSSNNDTDVHNDSGSKYDSDSCNKYDSDGETTSISNSEKSNSEKSIVNNNNDNIDKSCSDNNPSSNSDNDSSSNSDNDSSSNSTNDKSSSYDDDESMSESESDYSNSEYEDNDDEMSLSSNDEETVRNVLVYDFGGGTLDVCILSVQNGIFTTLANAGNTRMGGSDFDNRLMSFSMTVFKKLHGYKELENIPALSLQKLRLACESAKKILSTVIKSRIAIKNFYEGKDLIIAVTRDQFIEMCGDLFLICLRPVEDALRQLHCGPEDIDDVITIGGMTRMPKIRELLKQRFGKEPNCTINPDEAVACGAAIQGYLLSHKEDPFSRRIALLDCTSLSLGVESDNGTMSIIIPRGETIPVSKSQKYSTDSDYVNNVLIKVYEGERSIANEKGNFFVGEFELTGIDPVPRGIPEIEVTFNIDADGIIVVTAQNMKTHDASSMTVTSNKGRLTREQIEELVEEAKDYEIRDELEKRKKMMHYEIDDFCSNIMYNLNKKEVKLSDKDRTKITTDVNKVTKWLKEKTSEDREDEEYEKVIKNLKETYGVLVLHGHMEDSTVKECEESGAHGTTLYGNDDDDELKNVDAIFEKLEEEEHGYKGLSDPVKAELKELRQAIFDLSYSILEILDSGSLQISKDHAKELKEYIDDSLMWLYVHEKPTKIEYKIKIDSINKTCDKVFDYYKDNEIDMFKKNSVLEANTNSRNELENLCIIIKLHIDDGSIPLSKKELQPLYTEVNNVLDWIIMNDIKLEKMKDKIQNNENNKEDNATDNENNKEDNATDNENNKEDNATDNENEGNDIKIFLDSFHTECNEKYANVNEMSNILNQQIFGLNINDIQSTSTTNANDIILTGYNEDVDINNIDDQEGTSIINLVRNSHQNTMANLVEKSVNESANYQYESSDDESVEDMN
jgi:molecular chaperone DnaK (HSP70)